MQNVWAGFRRGWSGVDGRTKRKAAALCLIVVAGWVSLAVEERRTRLVWAELPGEDGPARAILADSAGAAASKPAPVEERTAQRKRESQEGSGRPGGLPKGHGSGVAAAGVPLNLNRATASELEALPGIGPALARRIVVYREAQGPFRTVEQLQEVSGIGPARLARLKGLVCVEENPGATP
ncbi:MAG TPA: helix-hairpin-helix domain-containing protein [Firmicutes bacterium]|nr:helix-hairpin-helix domain-containing protein [Bacillota bacterium]